MHCGSIWADPSERDIGGIRYINAKYADEFRNRFPYCLPGPLGKPRGHEGVRGYVTRKLCERQGCAEDCYLPQEGSTGYQHVGMIQDQMI